MESKQPAQHADDTNENAQPAAMTAPEPAADAPSTPVPAPESSGVLPAFLTHAANAAPVEPAAKDQAPDRPIEEAGHIERSVAESAHEAANAVGAFFSEGAAAVREMNAARKAHAEARDHLKLLEKTIGEQEEELAHRRDIASRYTEIVAEQQALLVAANEAKRAAQEQQAQIKQGIDAMKEQLKQMKDADAQTERRLKSALEAAEAQEASARESGARLQRRLDDATAALEQARKDRDDGIAAAREAIESTKAHLEALREEYAEIQRNPSANSAAYSIRADELGGEISNAADDARRAQEDLPRITSDVEDAVARAEQAVAEAQEPIDAAKQSFKAVSDAADAARDAYQTAKDDAANRQRALKERIAEQEKAKRAQADAEDQANEDARVANALIAEAEDIHAHPEVTETIAARLEADRAERAEQLHEVEQLAAAERTVRDRTRSSRLRFGVAIAGIAVGILIIVVLWFVLS